MCAAAACQHGRSTSGSTGRTRDHTNVSNTVNGSHFFHCLICQCKSFLIGQILICLQRYGHLITAHTREQDHTGIHCLVCTSCQKSDCNN